MELRYEYRLRLRFSQPARDHRFFLRVSPQSGPCQQLFDHQTAVNPCRFLQEGRDSFGNLCFYGAAERPHSEFSVRVSGLARTSPVWGAAEPEPERWRGMKYPSPYTGPGPRLRALIRSCPGAGDERSPLERAERLLEPVHDALTYRRGITTVETTAEQALELGSGVCQDYAHVLLALCRMERIPARYVVGMLQGEGESHAWVEVFSQGYWYGLDPTNLVRAQERHIRISRGRDAGDCAMNRGIFLGGGLQTQTVQVLVSPASDGETAIQRKTGRCAAGNTAHSAPIEE